MSDPDYTKDLEERVEQLEGLVGNEPMCAVRTLRECIERVKRIANTMISSHIVVRGSAEGLGVYIDVIFRGESDYTYLVLWEHCGMELPIRAAIKHCREKENEQT